MLNYLIHVIGECDLYKEFLLYIFYGKLLEIMQTMVKLKN